MTMGAHNRGQVRASCFDVTIAARRLENVSRTFAEVSPETREKISRLGNEARKLSLEIRSVLSPAEQADLSRVFD